MRGQVFTKEGIEYTLKQSPHISDCGQYYEANALSSEDEPTVTLYWPIVKQHVDESECCDWQEFEVV